MAKEGLRDEAVAPLLASIGNLLCEKSGQFMIVGLDSVLLEDLVHKISEIGKFRPVLVRKSKDESPNGKIFFIKLQNTSSMEYQALLYYYLELPLTSSCFVCLTSVSSLSLSFFEKRVRSRFKNRIFFLPYCSAGKPVRGQYCLPNGDAGSSDDEPATGPSEMLSCANHEIHKSLEMRDQCEWMRKYGLERYSLKYMFDLLEPIHFVLIMMAHSQRIVLSRCYDQFRRTVNDVPEIKKTPPGRVLCCVYDLMDAGIINSNGSLSVDFGEFKEFISACAPLYVQKLLRNTSRPKQ